MKPKITVLIPAYNRAQYIEECICSVQNQSLQDLEILIIDDGSTDNTCSICAKMAENDPRIRLLVSNHQGVSAARNIGLDVAKGQYVFFLDSDDIIHPFLLETLFLAMEKHGVPVSASSRHTIPEKFWHTVGRNISGYAALGNTILKKADEVIWDFFHARSPMRIIGGVMISRDWIGNTRFRPDLYIGEDYFFVYENLIKGSDAVYLQEIWYYARLHSSNSAQNCSVDSFINRLLRREMVWKSEEAFGRYDNAAVQKREVLSVCLRFMRITTTKEEKKQIRQTLRSYRKSVMPVLSLRNRLLFILLAYF